MIRNKRIKSYLLAACLGIVAVVASLSIDRVQASATTHEYTTLTGQRVEKALALGAQKKDIKLAEASLTALGWFVLYGNGTDSASLAQKLNKAVADAYNGTELMNPVYMNHTSEAYFEMLNLKRFENRKPVSPSPEYTELTRERVAEALARGAGNEEFRLAEGSLCALGWMTLHGNDGKSLALGRRLMSAAAKAWPGANEVYMLQSSEAYAEIINLGRFEAETGDVTMYDYNDARVVVKLDNKIEDDNYITYAKTLPLERYGARLEVLVRVIEESNYFTIVFVTHGVDLGGNGIGNSGGLLPYSSDWDLHRETQAIYANGVGLSAALDDLEKKFNGARGQCSFSGTGDATRGELVITLLGPITVGADGGAIRR